MKKLLILLVIVLISCSKSNSNIKLTGEWKIKEKKFDEKIDFNLYFYNNLIVSKEKEKNEFQFYKIQSNYIYIKDHLNDLYWEKVIIITNHMLLLRSEDGDDYLLFYKSSENIPDSIILKAKQFYTNEKNILPEIDSDLILNQVKNNNFELFDKFYTLKSDIKMNSYSILLYENKTEITNYRLKFSLYNIVLYKINSNEIRKFLFSEYYISDIIKIDKNNLKLKCEKNGDYHDDSGTYMLKIKITNNLINITN